jgi:uncharacterized repeat protein (TIGR04138 family)
VQAKVPDWERIRERARVFPEPAFQFVREGLAHTVRTIHTEAAASELASPSRHVSGQQLALGLADLAKQRYGLMAPVVLSRWGIRRTMDFGLIVYALIDRGELRSSDQDRLDDFESVFDFAETFSPQAMLGLKCGPRPALRDRSGRPAV